MHARRITRRQFLKTTGAAAGIALVGPSLLGCHCHRMRICPAAPPAPFVRRDIGNLTASDPLILSYRKAVKAMRALPPTNPLSWSYQAAIHGTTVTPTMIAWNSCTHGSPFFWSWHRMYLYWFERIIRKMSGDTCWTLPFWNWTSGTERQLPAMFRDTTSELFTPNRNTAMNDGSGSLPPGYVDYSAAFASTSFLTASSILEGTPHGAVHVGVGGWMGSVPTAAQDPIFYLHHCNIDRLWNLWLAQGGGRTDPLSDATWKSTPFTFFDENGAQVTMTSCDVLRAAKQLHYKYEGEPTQVDEFCEPPIAVVHVFERQTLLHLPIPPIVLGAKAVSFSMDVTALRRALGAAAENKTDALYLELEDVETERPPGVVWEVYLGLPDGVAPDSKSPYYVGNLALFGAGIRSEGHHFMPAKVTLRINEALQHVLGEHTRRIPVMLVPTGIEVNGKVSHAEPASPVRIGGVSITLEREKAEPRR